nr:hypothetical protein [Streptomyces anulatus]
MTTDRPGKVCLVADNAEPELLPDLVLTAHLLHADRAASVVISPQAVPPHLALPPVLLLTAPVRRIARRRVNFSVATSYGYRSRREGRIKHSSAASRTPDRPPSRAVWGVGPGSSSAA